LNGLAPLEVEVSIATNIRTVVDAYINPQAYRPMALQAAVVKTIVRMPWLCVVLECNNIFTKTPSDFVLLTNEYALTMQWIIECMIMPLAYRTHIRMW
jgi:hypothetical protein